MSPRREVIEGMFNNIARHYDALNRILSLGLDVCWRRAAIREVLAVQPKCVLDLAAGTGDMSATLLKRYSPQELQCADLSHEMLLRAQCKLTERAPRTQLTFTECAAEELPYADASFQAVMIGFGVRNFADIPQAMREVQRVLTPQGRLIVLEFSMPRRGLFAWLYRFYIRIWLPLIGGLVSGSLGAYRYLPKSMETYAQTSPLPEALASAGLVVRTTRALSGGAVLLTIAEKQNNA